MQSVATTSYVPRTPAWILSGGVRSDQARTTARLRASDLESCRAALMRYANRALRNVADAEDAVQDTMTAAMESSAGFCGRSSSMTWLHGILKHKIIDVFRRKSRETSLDEMSERECHDDCDSVIAADGHWQQAPADWGDPEVACSNRHFVEVLESCIARLPKNYARVITMRELMELDVSEICDALDISRNNCFVLLHRARTKLRTLLARRWEVGPKPQRKPSRPDRRHIGESVNGAGFGVSFRRAEATRVRVRPVALETASR